MGEEKVLEFGNIVLTTERLVWGTEVIPLSNVKSARSSINKGWSGMFIIAFIGLVIMSVGGGWIWNLIGFLLLPGAIAFFYYTIDRKLLLVLNDGDGQFFPIKTTARLSEMVNAINSTLSKKRQAMDNALRVEIDNLPTSAK